MIKINNAVATLFLGVILGLTGYAAVYQTHSPRGGGVSGQPPRSAPGAVSHAAVYHRLPLFFEANRGQAPASVHFLSRGPGYGLYLTSSGPELALRRDASKAPALVSVRLLGANTAARISGRHRQHGTVNYLKGKDPRHWHQGIPVYDQVAYGSVYPGIDMVFHGRADQLEYDFNVAPGADPGAIRMAFTGVDAMRLDRAGRLHLITGQGEVVQQAPVAYQMIGGVRRPVESRYVMGNAQRVAFAVSGYDRQRPLIIDPILSFSTYIGGAGDDRGWAIARDPSDGSIYITGRTASVDFPIKNAAYPNCGGTIDCTQSQISDDFLGATLNTTEWTASGDVTVDTQNHNLIMTTAAAANDRASVTTTGALKGDFDVHVSLSSLKEASKNTGIAVQINGSNPHAFWVTSSTTNQNYEVPDNGDGCTATTSIATAATDFEDTAELEVVRTGSTLTFLAHSLANPLLKTYVVVGTCSGVSTADATFQLFTQTSDGTAKTSRFDDFYASEGNGSPDAFVMGLKSDGSLSYATYLGGANQDEGLAIAASNGVAYVAGRTFSADFPTPNSGAFDLQCPDTNGDGECDNGADAFVAVLDSGGALSYATYFGGCYDDAANAIAVDGSGMVYIGGYTNSAPDTATPSSNATCLEEFPLKNALQTTNKGRKDAFVAKLNPAGGGASDLVYSTFLGGAYADEVLGIAVDTSDQAYVTGYTASSDFPVSGAFQATLGNDIPGATPGYDAFVAKLNATGNALVYSSYLGGSAYDYGQGIAVDGSGNAYVTGWTRSIDFPTVSPIQSANSGSYDAFVAKINSSGSALVYSTYLGGTDTEEAQAIAVDSNGNAVITGYTTSSDFLISLLRDRHHGDPVDMTLDFLQDAQSVSDPSLDNSIDPKVDPGTDCPVLFTNSPESPPDTDTPYEAQPNLNNYVLNNLSVPCLAQALHELDTTTDLAGLTKKTRSDLIGGIFDAVNTLVQKELQPIQPALAGSSDAFVVKLDSSGSVSEATFLGGGDEDYGTGVALDGSGNPYITGYTVTNPLNSASGLGSGLSQAQNFPVTSTADTSLSDASTNSTAGREEDAFIAKLDDGSVNVGVTLTADPAGAVGPDTNVTYTATVTNQGTTTAEAVVLTNTLYDPNSDSSSLRSPGKYPLGLNLVSAGAGQGSCTPSAADITKFTHVITCSLGALVAGASTTVTIKATASPALPPDTPQDSLPTDHVSVTALATNSSTNTSTEVHTPINVNVPPAAERTCDFNATKPTGCTVPKLGGAFDPYTLVVLALSLATVIGLRRRVGRRHNA